MKDLETVRRALTVQDAAKQRQVSEVLRKYEDFLATVASKHKAEIERGLDEKLRTPALTFEDALTRAHLRNLLGALYRPENSGSAEP